MNDKLCKHVNILFAAAPKNQKAEEIKEELLTNLNDKYNDLLANGYDSTAAFHIALSGIGDIDELLKECGGTVQVDAPSTSSKPQTSQIPMLLVLAFNLFCIFPSLPMFLMGPVPSIFGSIFLLWGFAGSVLVYAIASSFIGRGKAESTLVSPMFSKRKVVRMSLYLGLAICLFLLVEAFRVSYPYRGFELLGLLGYLVALGFYICALVALVKKEPNSRHSCEGRIQTEDLTPVSLAPRLRGGDGENGVIVLLPAPKSRLPLWLGLIAGLIVGLLILSPGVVPFFVVGGSTGFGVFGMFLCVAIASGLFTFAVVYAIVYIIVSLCEGQGGKAVLASAAILLVIVPLSFFLCSFAFNVPKFLPAGVPWQMSIFGNAITPTGPVIVEEREIGDLSMLDIIDVHSAVTVEFKLSDRNLITVETHADMMQNIHTEIRGGTLLIVQHYPNRYRNVKKLLVTVYSPSVPKHLFQVSGASRLICEEPIKVEGVSLYASGASQLRFKSIESTSSINFKLDGASSAEVAGSAESVHVQARGASQLRASLLDVSHCDVDISGASRAELGSIGSELSIRASGASHFGYRGTPTIKRQNVSGAARINIFDRENAPSGINLFDR